MRPPAGRGFGGGGGRGFGGRAGGGGGRGFGGRGGRGGRGGFDEGPPDTVVGASDDAMPTCPSTMADAKERRRRQTTRGRDNWAPVCFLPSSRGVFSTAGWVFGDGRDFRDTARGPADVVRRRRRHLDNRLTRYDADGPLFLFPRAEVGTFMHACEGEAVCKLTNVKVRSPRRGKRRPTSLRRVCSCCGNEMLWRKKVDLCRLQPSTSAGFNTRRGGVRVRR